MNSSHTGQRPAICPSGESSSQQPLKRIPSFVKEPGHFSGAELWLYGNIQLLERELGYVAESLGAPDHLHSELEQIQTDAERITLSGRVLVCGVHNEAHRSAAVVPLRWGAPRIVVLSGGFHWHLGPNLDQEPFRVARLWRYRWDPVTDLAVSRRAPDRLPTYARHNPSVDRLIRAIAEGTWNGREAFHAEQEHVGSVLHRLVSTFVGALL